jgi:hypothetical protein
MTSKSTHVAMKSAAPATRTRGAAAINRPPANRSPNARASSHGAVRARKAAPAAGSLSCALSASARAARATRSGMRKRVSDRNRPRPAAMAMLPRPDGRSRIAANPSAASTAHANTLITRYFTGNRK